MLAIDAVTVTYPGVTAVRDVSLAVPDGCVLALLGPSGCGKSTLLRAVAGLEPVRTGTVSWDTVDLARIPVHRRGFGLMFQDGVLFPHRSVGQNVRYGLKVAGVRGAEADRRVAELLDLVGLNGFAARSVTELSGGEAQRVALARALAPRPRLLLLDEPLAALDRALRESLLADLRTILTQTGTPAIFVTHDQQEAFAIADKVALMRAGRILRAGEPRAVWDRPADEWEARFLGYTTVLRARPVPGVDGTCCSVTAFGSVAGRTELVGLRPEALVVDSAGSIDAVVTALVPGPERTRLTVRVGPSRVDGAAGSAEGVEAHAVAPASEALRIGDGVRLRWHPEGAAPIGGRTPTGDPVPVGGPTPTEDRGADTSTDRGASDPGAPSESERLRTAALE